MTSPAGPGKRRNTGPVVPIAPFAVVWTKPKVQAPT